MTWEITFISCGWGFLPIEAAKKYKVHGTGITLSVEQHREFERRIQEEGDEVRQQFDERFVRMWHLYLASCAAAFHNGIIALHQVLFTKGINNDIPMVRWY